MVHVANAHALAKPHRSCPQDAQQGKRQRLAGQGNAEQSVTVSRGCGQVMGGQARSGHNGEALAKPCNAAEYGAH